MPPDRTGVVRVLESLDADPVEHARSNSAEGTEQKGPAVPLIHSDSWTWDDNEAPPRPGLPGGGRGEL